MKQILVRQPLKLGNLIVLFVAVLMSGFWGHCFGLNIYFGPLLFGLLIPSGLPLGSVLVKKLDLITYWMLLPLYFVKFGLTVDFFSLSIRTYSRVQFISLLGACGKFLGASLSALISSQMPLRDAVSLGFVMTFQGIIELGFFKLMKSQTEVMRFILVLRLCVDYTLLKPFLLLAKFVQRSLGQPLFKVKVKAKASIPFPELYIIGCHMPCESLDGRSRWLSRVNLFGSGCDNFIGIREWIYYHHDEEEAEIIEIESIKRLYQHLIIPQHHLNFSGNPRVS
ncbi:hypothetical protein CRYUN_Cryun40dG0038600 [Craigia yunnanensis]